MYDVWIPTMLLNLYKIIVDIKLEFNQKYLKKGILFEKGSYIYLMVYIKSTYTVM